MENKGESAMFRKGCGSSEAVPINLNITPLPSLEPLPSLSPLPPVGSRPTESEPPSQSPTLPESAAPSQSPAPPESAAPSQSPIPSTNPTPSQSHVPVESPTASASPAPSQSPSESQALSDGESSSPSEDQPEQETLEGTLTPESGPGLEPVPPSLWITMGATLAAVVIGTALAILLGQKRKEQAPAAEKTLASRRQMKTARYTDAGGRPCNEDAVRQVLREPDRLCLVVADGLGGHGGGALASATAADTICAGWDGSADSKGLKELVQQAHRAVRAIQTPGRSMKSTVAVLEVAGNRAAWAHVGDTRLYHFQDGRLVFQTRDHSASQAAVYMGEITADQIRFHEDRNWVLRAVGQAEDPLTVEAAQQELTPGRHAFLLCSDGFWEYVTEPEMAADLASAASPTDWLGRMRGRLAARVPADNDNNTAAAVWVEVP